MMKRTFVAAAVAGILAAPAAFADNNDLDPYWKSSRIERTSAADIRAEAARAARTAPDPLREPGRFHY